MLTLSVSGKAISEAVDILREAVKGEETELKILIDDPLQAQELQKFLQGEGFSDILPEDDDGTLYLTAKRTITDPQTITTPPTIREAAGTPRPLNPASAYGVVLSGSAHKQNYEFMTRFITALAKTAPEPDLLCLMNNAVKLAAYNTHACDVIKKMTDDGVRVLVSASCADRMGITEALGAGTLVSLSEILEAVGRCDKLLSI